VGGLKKSGLKAGGLKVYGLKVYCGREVNGLKVDVFNESKWTFSLTAHFESAFENRINPSYINLS